MRLLDDDGEEWIERLEMGIDILFSSLTRLTEDHWPPTAFAPVGISTQDLDGTGLAVRSRQESGDDSGPRDHCPKRE